MSATRLSVWLVLVLVAAAGCGDQTAGGKPHRSASPSGSASATPSLTPVSFGDQPLWSGGTTTGDAGANAPRLSKILGFGLADDTVLYVGEDAKRESHGRLVAADAQTGKLRWSIASGDKLGGDGARADLGSFDEPPPVVRRGEEFTALVEYQKADTAEQGLAALSLKDGKVQWTIPVSKKRGTSVVLRAADAGILLVSVADTDGGTVTAIRTVAYDAASHRKLWQASGVKAAAVVGRTVLAEKPSHLPYDPLKAPPATVLALDAATGSGKWDLDKRYRDASVTHVAGPVTVLQVEHDTTALVDTETGHELAILARETPADGSATCRSDDTVLACTVVGDDGPGVVGMRLADASASTPRVFRAADLTVDAVWQGQIYATDSAHGSATVLDPSGARASLKLPGRLAALDSGYAVFYSGRLETGTDIEFEVHRVEQ